MDRLAEYLHQAGALAQAMGSPAVTVPHLLLVVVSAIDAPELAERGLTSAAVGHYMRQHEGLPTIGQATPMGPDLMLLVGWLEGAVLFGAITEVDDAAIVKALLAHRDVVRIAELV